MKHFLILLFFISFLSVSAQVTVTVSPGDTTVCYGDSVAFTAVLSGSYTGTVSYVWQKNLIDIPGANDSIYSISKVGGSSQGLYSCIVTVNALADTSENAQLRMYPKMKFDTLYRYNPLGCPGDCKGQFKTLVSGGTLPYYYNWHGGHSQDTIVFGLCPGGPRILTVFDSTECSIDTSYYVEVLTSPKVDFVFNPRDTIYLTNPNTEVAFPDSMRQYITNWTWDFGDSIKIANLNPLAHTYSEEIMQGNKAGKFAVRLSFTDKNGCDTTIMHELYLKLTDLKIPNVFTPNGDGYNDKFHIWLNGEKETDFREAYLGNSLVIFDRWGKKVYERTDYKSEDWDGGNLSDGTYFYILKCTGQYREDVFKGSVAILRGGQ